MRNVKIEYRITAVRNRQQYVDDLLERMAEPESSVLWDEERRGCIWNTMRAWGSWRTLPEGTTHLCVMSDDADVVGDYKELVQMCVERWPQAIWTFFSNEMTAKHGSRLTPYVKLLSYNIRGIAFLMPVEWVQGYVDFYDKFLRRYDYPRDDATCRIWACMNRLPVMTTIPNLVRSREIPSEMRYHGTTHNSDAWKGYELDKRFFNQMGYIERTIKAKSAVETHLPKENPVDIMVNLEYERQMKLNKLHKGN